MNPFKEKAKSLTSFSNDWKKMYPKSYDKHSIDPYTKTRIILMNGTEFEANWFSHQFARHVCDNDLRRDLATVREMEKEQQLKLSLLKPEDESVLEHTISYEQLATDLTAELAKRETNLNVKNALNFALLEDFDHLYRYANLLEMRDKIHAETLVGRYTEIMPGRPTIAHHRCPVDNVKYNITNKKNDVQTVLNTMIITGAEQQTMNYYMNVATFNTDDLSRKLYQEIALVEEEHVTSYESLIDCNGTLFEMALWHEYLECYLYWSCYQTETDSYVKKLWEENLDIELAHLNSAVRLLNKYENKDWCEVIPDGTFPEPISLHENIDYVRDVLNNSVQYTSCREKYCLLKDMDEDSDFFHRQNSLNKSVKDVPSHMVIEEYLEKNKEDYRYETEENPISELRDRSVDNTKVGRCPCATEEKSFFKNC